MPVNQNSNISQAAQHKSYLTHNHTEMKKIATLLACAASLSWMLLGSSCVNPKEVLYLQDVTSDSSEQLSQNYQTVIQKDDQLYITVSSKQPELTRPFMMAEMGNVSSSNSSDRPIGYLVDANGDIVLPVIGKMRAAGKTCTQLGQDIATTLRSNDYIRDASVNVQITNFKFSVLGEVKSPGMYKIDGQRLTLLEAVTRAGDLSIDGNRDITLIREVNGKREIAQIDLRSKELFNSPYYYVQQNDVIYVTPSDRKVNTRSDLAQWWGWSLSGAGIIIACIALAV